MSNAHTPGPWCIGAPPPNGEQTIGTQQGLMVAVATTGAGTPTKANARLIAAAPELLGFVDEFIEAWNSGMAGDSYLLRLANAVKAKATGGQ